MDRQTDTPKKGSGIKNFFRGVFRLRGLLLSLPVAVASGYIAYLSYHNLPETVGLLMQPNGDFQFIITRQIAVLAPLAITFLCILITICAKKVIFPWLLSIFSLIIPGVLWLTNVF